MKLDARVADLEQIRAERMATLARGEDPTDKDWLSRLPVDTVFLSQSVKFRPFLDEYEVVFKTEKSVQLCMNQNCEDHLCWVDPKQFSLDNIFIEVLRKAD